MQDAIRLRVPPEVSHMSYKDFLVALGVIAIWGANAAIGKLAVPQIPALTFLIMRFALTGLLFVPFIEWKKAYVISAFKIAFLLNFLHYGFVFSALPYLDASALALIQQIQVPAAVLIGAFVFREKLQLKIWLGIAAGFAGVAMIKTVDHVTLLGFSLALAGGIAWAVANTEMKRHDDLPLPTFMGLTTLLSVPFLGVTAFFTDHNVWTKIIAANWLQVGFVLAYQVILGCWAMMAWKKLVTLYPVNKIVPLTLLQPLFGIAGGMVLFHERLSIQIIIGGILIMTGVATVIFNRKTATQAEPLSD